MVGVGWNIVGVISGVRVIIDVVASGVTTSVDVSVGLSCRAIVAVGNVVAVVVDSVIVVAVAGSKVDVVVNVSPDSRVGLDSTIGVRVGVI